MAPEALDESVGEGGLRQQHVLPELDLFSQPALLIPAPCVEVSIKVYVTVGAEIRLRPMYMRAEISFKMHMSAGIRIEMYMCAELVSLKISKKKHVIYKKTPDFVVSCIPFGAGTCQRLTWFATSFRIRSTSSIAVGSSGDVDCRPYSQSAFRFWIWSICLYFWFRVRAFWVSGWRIQLLGCGS